MKLSRYPLIFVWVALIAGCVNAPKKPAQVQGDDYAYTRERLGWLIEDRMTEQGIVGLSIALVDDQRIVWSRGFGYADEKNHVQATEQTIYRAGSVTKLFTATAIMQLVEQGKIDLDRPLQEYLPEFQIRSRFDSGGAVTPRQMLTHHSGLPSDRINGMWGESEASYRDLPQQLRSEYLSFQPGQVRAYSNLAYSLLGVLIERVSGISYAEYVRQHILEPAAMHQAYVGALGSGGAFSKGYYKQQETAVPALRDQPAGSLNASVVDLARFAKLTFRIQRGAFSPILSQATLDNMQRYQDGKSVFDIQPVMGLGWAISESFGKRAGLMLGHDGGTPMFSTQFLTLPKHKLAVVVMANSNDASTVVSEVATEALKLMLESKTGIKVPEYDGQPKNEALLQSDLNDLPGSWSSQFGWVDIEQDDTQLSLKFQDLNFDLVRRDDNRLYLEYALFGLLDLDIDLLKRVGAEYRRIEDHEFLVAVMDGKAREILAQKIRPHGLSAAWQARLGKYHMVNGQGGIGMDNVELICADEVLQLQGDLSFEPGETETIRLPLMPVNDNEAVVQGIGRQMGGTLHSVEDGKSFHLEYSGFVFEPE